MKQFLKIGKPYINGVLIVLSICYLSANNQRQVKVAHGISGTYTFYQGSDAKKFTSKQDMLQYAYANDWSLVEAYGYHTPESTFSKEVFIFEK